MNHLEAFMSDDAKRGRVWTDKLGLLYRRVYDHVECKDKDRPTDQWVASNRQLSAVTYSATWADEPKTLTPQEVLHALADGKCISNGSRVMKLTPGGTLVSWRERHGDWQYSPTGSFDSYYVAPHPFEKSTKTERPQRDHHGAFSPSECEPPAIYHARHCKGACVCWQATI